MIILTVNNKKDEKFLRTVVQPILIPKDKTEKQAELKTLRELSSEMRVTMGEANGVGLSANQVGVSKRLFVANAPSSNKYRSGMTLMSTPKELFRSPTGQARNDAENNHGKFYAIINPEIIKKSKEMSVIEEGCLSIPLIFGEVERPEMIVIKGLNLNGKRFQIKISGIAARIFQHEIDHLNGILFTDKARNVRQMTND